MVQDLVGLEPALAGDPQADGDVGHAARRMGVRADRAGDAQLARPPHHAPIEVETMRIRVHLHRDAARGGFGEHLLQVDRVRLALQQQPASRMTEDREMGIAHGRERSEEHTSELQSHSDLVCRLLLEKKKKKQCIKKITDEPKSQYISPRSSWLSYYPFRILFFFNDTATTEIYTLSLHDALPISMPRAAALASTCSRSIAYGSRCNSSRPVG